LEYATECPVNIIEDEINMGDQDDLPLEQHEGLQSSSLHKENQSMKQLEEDVKDIRRWMLRSAEEAVNKEKLDKG
jgi:hypothetical protein